jgi:hypothetical protein
MKTKWLPIETAPKDGTEIVLISKTSDSHLVDLSAKYFFHESFIGSFSFHSKEWIDLIGHIPEDKPTHWMHIPEFEDTEDEKSSEEVIKKFVDAYHSLLGF